MRDPNKPSSDKPGFFKELFSEIKSEMERELSAKDQARLDATPPDSGQESKSDSKDLNVLSRSRDARFKLTDLILPSSTENEIRESLVKVRFHELIYKDWGFEVIDPSGAGCVLNFYGPPGTGKSRGAEALAGELGMPFLKVDLAELESKFMGETAKNLSALFAEAQETGALLFFDEADTVLGKRLSSVTQGVDAEINMTRSTMLIEMDSFTGVLVFASNFPENYDSAFRRRISHHINFALPDYEARVRLWDLHLVPNIPLACCDRIELLKELADKTESFSGGYILQAMRLALPMAVNTDLPQASQLTQIHLEQAIELVKRGMREVGGDVQERLDNTRQLFGIKQADDEQRDKESAERMINLSTDGVLEGEGV
jgi:DNA polymerase III delta prime subunit